MFLAIFLSMALSGLKLWQLVDLALTLVTLAVSGCTVMVMCPSMSLIATALFTGIDAEFFARFLATLYRNLPWALLWQIFAAGPATRGVFRAIFRRQLVENDGKAFSSDTECDKMDA
jgi:hypothetical protein